MSNSLSDRTRLQRAPRGFTTRRVPALAPSRLIRDVPPRAGDLVLARIDRIGHHRRLEQTNGRRRRLFEGDEVILAYGARYAPRQFEAIVPPNLDPCHMAAGGGIAAKVVSSHARMSRGATAITPVGLVADRAGWQLNVADFALAPASVLEGERPIVLGVIGTSMDAGKTTTAALLARGLALAGNKVGYAKVTGTGSGGDLWHLHDAGASPVYDFTDAGFASTYRATPLEVERIAVSLIHHLGVAGVDVAIVEVADGPLQRETRALLDCAAFQDVIDGVLIAAMDAMGTASVAGFLRKAGFRILGVSGAVTASPLQQNEVVEATRLPILTVSDLADPATARKLLEQARA